MILLFPTKRVLKTFSKHMPEVGDNRGEADNLHDIFRIAGTAPHAYAEM